LPQISQTCAMISPDDCQAGWMNNNYNVLFGNPAIR